MRTSQAACVLALLGLGACQTAPQPEAGFMTGYDRLEPRKKTLRATIRERRDDVFAARIDAIFIEPSVTLGAAGADLEEDDRRLVLREVDRQVCYELSEKFTVLQAPDPQAGRVRVGVTRIAPTGRLAGAASAAANYFIPGPLGVRAPGTTGGLAAEAELLGPGESGQVAAMSWARDAKIVGTDDPSLSRVGDALQLAEPFGDAVGEAFAPKDRKSRSIAKLDPCAGFGPRMNPGGMVAGMITGLYVPELSGAGAFKEAAR